MNDRKVVEECLNFYEMGCHLQDPLGVFCGNLNEIQENVGKFFSMVKGQLDNNYNLVGDISFDLVEHYEGCDIRVSFKRLETDSEYNTRIKKELKKAEASEKRRKANLEKLLKNDDETWELYQELKKKYGE